MRRALVARPSNGACLRRCVAANVVHFLRTVAQRQRANQREQRSWWQRLVSYGNMSGAWFLAARSLRHYI